MPDWFTLKKEKLVKFSETAKVDNTLQYYSTLLKSRTKYSTLKRLDFSSFVQAYIN